MRKHIFSTFCHILLNMTMIKKELPLKSVTKPSEDTSLFRQWVFATTWHGIADVYNASGWIIRCVWVILVGVSTVLFVQQATQQIREYACAFFYFWLFCYDQVIGRTALFVNLHSYDTWQVYSKHAVLFAFFEKKGYNQCWAVFGALSYFHWFALSQCN